MVFNLCQESIVWSWMCLESFSSGSTVCVCVSVGIPAEWNGWIPQGLSEMLSAVRNSCFYSVSVSNRKFSWFISNGLTGYGRHSSGGGLFGASEDCSMCLASASSLHVEITSLLGISNGTFYSYLHRFGCTGGKLVFVFPLCVTHISGC